MANVKKSTSKTAKPKQKKVAVVLLNLGGPDSKNAVRPFLTNFFMDKNIIRLPIPFRCMLAWLIAKRRSVREAKDSYDEIGGFSPLLKNTQAQAKALEKVIKADKTDAVFKTFVCMRYWHPMSAQVVREVNLWGADEVLLLPLYPQYSTTTTRSSLQAWQKAAHEAGIDISTSMVCCYPFNDGFIETSAHNIAVEYKRAQKDGHEKIRVLFSAHGLPESIIKEGDPYQWQCEVGANKMADALKALLKIEDLDYAVCYQSRVGPKKWIGPSTEEELERAAHDKTAVVIYPSAFTQEHVETLVELDIEYREEAEKIGQHGYYRADTVGTHPAFIAGLVKLVHEHVGTLDIAVDGKACVCPEKFEQCCMREMDLKNKL